MVREVSAMRRWAVPFGRGSLLLIGALLHAQDGAAIFQRECAACHNGAADSRAPSREVLAQRSPEGILQALSAGTMRPQGAHLSGNERRAVAEFLSGKKISGDVTGASTGRCETQRPFSATPPLWSNWEPRLRTRDSSRPIRPGSPLRRSRISS